jgi:hypothetical protein
MAERNFLGEQGLYNDGGVLKKLPETNSVFSGLGSLKIPSFDFGSSSGGNSGGSWLSKINWFGDSGLVGSLASAAGAGASLYGAIKGNQVAREQVRAAEEANRLAREQWETENKRYDERESERKAANASFQNSAARIYNEYFANKAAATPAAATPAAASEQGALSVPQEQSVNLENKELPTERA